MWPGRWGGIGHGYAPQRRQVNTATNLTRLWRLAARQRRQLPELVQPGGRRLAVLQPHQQVVLVGEQVKDGGNLRRTISKSALSYMCTMS